MKQPLTWMQEIREHNDFADIDFINDMMNRRDTPFKPEILLEYGFKPNEESNFFDKGEYYLNDQELVIEFMEEREVKIYKSYDNNISKNFCFTSPLWKTIDEMESDLSRVMESLK